MSEPFKPGYFWLTVAIDHTTGLSEPIDLSSAAIVAIITPDQADVARFWIDAELSGAWVTIAKPDGEPLDFRMMRSRAIPIPVEYTRPFDTARLVTPIGSIPLTFAVCVQPI